jgi:hypothetical protein
LKSIFWTNVIFDEDSMFKVILDSSNNTLVCDEDSLVDPTMEFYVEEQIPTILVPPPILVFPP